MINSLCAHFFHFVEVAAFFLSSLLFLFFLLLCLSVQCTNKILFRAIEILETIVSFFEGKIEWKWIIVWILSCRTIGENKWDSIEGQNIYTMEYCETGNGAEKKLLIVIQKHQLDPRWTYKKRKSHFLSALSVFGIIAVTQRLLPTAYLQEQLNSNCGLESCTL